MTANRCRDCGAANGHELGCWRLCPNCLTGTLTYAEQRITAPETRTYSCGCPWIAPEALVLYPGLAAAEQATYIVQVEAVRAIIANHLEGHLVTDRKPHAIGSPEWIAQFNTAMSGFTRALNEVGHNFTVQATMGHAYHGRSDKARELLAAMTAEQREKVAQAGITIADLVADIEAGADHG